MHHYEPLKRLALNLVLPQIGGPPWPVLIDGTVYTMRMQTHRLRLFKKSQNCACCGVRGKFFCIELTSKRKTPCLNLYGTGGYKNRFVVPLTVDHIVPQSKGGPTRMENLQVLCDHCNQAKANDFLSIEELRDVVVQKAIKRVKKIQKMGKDFIWKNPLELQAYETVLYGAPLKGGLNKEKCLLTL